MDVLKPPGQFHFNDTNLDDAWRRWERQFRTYFAACELSKKDKKVQVAILLHAAGPEAQEIHRQFEFAEGEDPDNYEDILKKFQTYCKPGKNTVFERYRFWCRNQGTGENVDSWIKDLKTKAGNCEFGDQNDLMIRDKLVFGVSDERVKERLLRESDLTLKKAVDVIHAAETTRQQIREMSSGAGPVQVSAVRQNSGGSVPKYGKKRQTRPPPQPPLQQSGSQTRRYEGRHSSAGANSIECRKCGRTHKYRECPAYGKQCKQCQGWGHFVVFHKAKKLGDTRRKVDFVTYDSETDSEDDLFFGAVHVLNLDSATVHNDDWVSDIRVGETDISFKLDSGAQGNILPLDTYRRIIPAVCLKPTRTVLSGFTRDIKVKPLGTVTYKCQTRHGASQDVTFFVVKEADTPLMGRVTCQSLGLISLVQAVVTGSALTFSKLKELYPPVFDKKLGELGEPYSMQLDPSIRGQISAAHKIPFARMERLKSTLDKLEQSGVIADAEGPTDWVNNLVITEKRNGALRLCLDPKPLNRAIKREHFEIPTPDEVQAKLAGKSVFSVFDMSNAYWHVRLTDESSHYTTFHTPWGRKRFLRMPFGISSASEVLQKRVSEVFRGIEGAHVIHDDMIIAGASEEDHDNIVHQVMERAMNNKVKFNDKNSDQFKVNKVMYMGNYYTESGLQPDPEKIRAIIEMPMPEDKAALLRVLGMVKFLSKFIPNESEVTAPVRELLKDGAIWSWQPEHTEAMEKLKTLLASAPVLKYYDVNKPVIIQADASQSGLGACLIQEGQPVAYASRALTSAEQNYAQLEKELLAICYACTKFHQYIYGKDVLVQSDHKPLESIMKKPIARASPRVQRMMMRLQRYNPGKDLFLADTLSRAYVQDHHDKELLDDIEVMVHSVIQEIPASPVKLEEIRRATADCTELQQLRQVVMSGWPVTRKSVPREIEAYWNIRDEITVIDGLLFAGRKLIIPRSMRSVMLELLHESHQGVEKSKARARNVMYWPGINGDISRIVTACSTCLRYRSANPKEPMLPHDIPDLPFQKIAMDIMTFQGSDYLVIVDYHSKYPEIVRLSTGKSAKQVISHVKSVCARHGIPAEIVADNMPFSSSHFRDFCAEWGIELTTSSPTYAQSNGQAEKMVGVIKQMLYKADEDGRDPYIALLEYRNTPVTGLPFSPAQMAMSRTLRSKLPSTHQMLKPAVVNATSGLRARQARYKHSYDRSAKPLAPLKAGDVVRYRRGKVWEPAVVKAETGFPRSFKILHENGELRRNRRHLMLTSEKPPVLLNVPEPCLSNNPQPPAAGPTEVLASSPPSPPSNDPVVLAVPEPRARRSTKTPHKYRDFILYR